METFEPKIFASATIQGQPENYIAVEIHGARRIAGADGVKTSVVDDLRPDHIGTYVRDKQQRLLKIAEFGSHGEALPYAKELAERYGWELVCPTGFSPGGLMAA